MYQTVACFTDPIEAHIVCGRLHAEGFTAYVAGGGADATRTDQATRSRRCT